MVALELKDEVIKEGLKALLLQPLVAKTSKKMSDLRGKIMVVAA